MAQGQTANKVTPEDDWKDVPVSGGEGDWKDVEPSKPTLMDRAKSFAHTSAEFEKGAVKGALKTSEGFGNLMGLGLPDYIQSKVAPDAVAQREKMLTPHGTAQELGHGAEQAAEYLLPIPGLEEERIGSGVVKAAERGGKALLKRVANTGLREGAKSAVVGSLQTGSLKEGAKQGAVTAVTAPPIQEISRAVTPLLRKSAQHLYERFLIPGGGAGYNKNLGREGAEELIRRGQVWLTKGTAVRDVEQRVMNASNAIESAEDRLLETMGYAPTGRSSVHATTEPFTEHVGPTIDITPDSSGPPAVISKEVDRPQRAVGSRLPPPDDEGFTRTGTRTRYSRVDETKKGMLYARDAVSKLRAMRGAHIVEGQVIAGHGPVLKARQQLIRQIESLMTPSGYIKADSAIKLRRSWDALVDWDRNPQAANLKPGVKTAYEETANALRHEIAEQVPGMKEANADYHFFSGLNKVFKDKENQKTGHRVIGPIGALFATAAGAGSYAHGDGPEKAAALAILTGVASHVVNSGAALTGSAVAMDRMGQAMASRNYQAVVNWLAKAAPSVARNVQANAPQSDK